MTHFYHQKKIPENSYQQFLPNYFYTLHQPPMYAHHKIDYLYKKAPLVKHKNLQNYSSVLYI